LRSGSERGSIPTIGSDEVHYAVGLGLAFWTFQLDLAVDFSDLVDTVSLSAIYQF
jgi:hypothetical protein